MSASIPYWDFADLHHALGFRGAVAALERALRGGYDPATDVERLTVPVRSGELLLMASDVAEWTGIKIVTVAPHNPADGLPRIQGVFTLFRADTLTPAALIDGAALTLLRTPAVSMAGIRPLLSRSDEPLRVVLYGRGPQAFAHAEALVEATAESRDIAGITMVTRTAPGSLPKLGPVPIRAVDLASAAAPLAEADLVLCVTTARTPLFEGSVLKDGCIVVAVGSHEPDARELDSALLSRSHVIVEDPGTALREAGDIILAVQEGCGDLPQRLIPMVNLVSGAVVPEPDRPFVFKTTGMGWQDLVVAAAAAERIGGLSMQAPRADAESGIRPGCRD